METCGVGQTASLRRVVMDFAVLEHGCNVDLLVWPALTRTYKVATLSYGQSGRDQRSQIRQGYPLNLSISVSGGKETNKDSPSNGE